MKNFAVVLNMKARKVNRGTLDMISKHVDVEDIYITHTVEQSDQSLDEIIKKRYPLVLCGGGDGTAMRIMEQMYKKAAKLNENGGDYTVPHFGLLKLGTGNGWAGYLEVPGGVKPIWAIRQMRENELKFENFNMMESKGRIFHFGGFGVDALVLNDYIELKNNYTEGFMWKLSNSLAGYAMTLASRSVPKAILDGFELNVRVINQSDEPVYKVNHSTGSVDLKLRKGDTIFEGRTLISGFGTTSNYGFNLKVYPFALMKPGYFQLRIADMSVPSVLLRLKDLWDGTMQHEGLHDFLVKDVRIESDNEMPFQLGGDPEGYQKSLEVKVSDFAPKVLDFRR